MFNMYFFYGYNIFMYFVQYKEKVNRCHVYSLYALLGCMILIVTFGLYTFGLIFIYQQVISLLYSMAFLLACITWDKNIVDYTEKIGFVILSSRKLKFKVLFICLISFFFVMIAYQSTHNNWADQILWIVKATTGEH